VGRGKLLGIEYIKNEDLQSGDKVMIRTSTLRFFALSVFLIGLAWASQGVVSNGYGLLQQGKTCRPFPIDRYLFIETRTVWHIEVVEGRFGLWIDFPTYLYYEDQQILETIRLDQQHQQLVAEPTFLAIWGDHVSVEVVNGIGGGAGSDIIGIYELPFRPKDNRSFELLRIESDGTVTVRFHEQQLTLKTKESWQTTTEPQIKHNASSTIKESFTYRINNLGLWPKQKLHLQGLMLDLGSPIEQVIDRNSDTYIDDREIIGALDLWVRQAPVPGTTNQVIDDCGILSLLQLWIAGSPIW
jgi:hypothetical protein